MDSRGMKELESTVLAIMVTPEGKWWPGCMWETDLKMNKAPVACMQYNPCCVCDGHFITSVVRKGLERLSLPRESDEKKGRFWLSATLRSHQMWLKGIKDSFEGGWERLRTVLTSIEIPSKSLYITLIKPRAVWYTKSYWSYRKATTYRSCLVKV